MNEKQAPYMYSSLISISIYQSPLYFLQYYLLTCWQVIKAGSTTKLSSFSTQIGCRDSQVGTSSSKSLDDGADHANGHGRIAHTSSSVVRGGTCSSFCGSSSHDGQWYIDRKCTVLLTVGPTLSRVMVQKKVDVFTIHQPAVPYKKYGRDGLGLMAI
jgi:hypothetical protein